MYDNYMGVIQALGFQFAPENWAYCNGALIMITQQTALYSLLGCEFGGNCTSVFGYPDLRGRLAMGQGHGPGLSLWQVGMMPGWEESSLSLAELPTHTHTHTYGGAGSGGDATVEIEVSTQLAKKQMPAAGDYIGVREDSFGSASGNTFVAASSVTKAVPIGGVDASGGGSFYNTSFSINTTGLNDDVSVMAPSQVVNYCLCIDGYYPSRS